MNFPVLVQLIWAFTPVWPRMFWEKHMRQHTLRSTRHLFTGNTADQWSTRNIYKAKTADQWSTRHLYTGNTADQWSTRHLNTGNTADQWSTRNIYKGNTDDQLDIYIQVTQLFN